MIFQQRKHEKPKLPARGPNRFGLPAGSSDWVFMRAWLETN